MDDKNPFKLGRRQLQADKKVINPLVFSDNDEPVKPIYSIEDHPNDEKKFAILKTTENGKYVRNGSLFFKINGVELYADIDDVLFVDLVNKTVFIQKGTKYTDEVDPVDPEKKQYIIMMNNDDGDKYTWAALSGRTEMYRFIVDNIDTLAIDPVNSFVLVETVPYKDALTVEQFVKYLKNMEFVSSNDGFDIDEYII